MTGTIPASAQRRNPPDHGGVLPTDPLSEALERPFRDPMLIPISESEALEEAALLVDEADRGDFSPWLVSRTISLAVQFPANEQLQYNVGRLLLLSGDTETARICWRGIVERFPQSYNAFPQYLRTVLNAFGGDVANEILASHCAEADLASDPAAVLLVARCRTLLGAPEEALTLLEKAHPGPLATEFTVAQAQLHRMAGRFDQALALLENKEAATAAPDLARNISTAARLFKGPHAAGPPSVAAIDTLIGMALEKRESRRPDGPVDGIGRVILIGGSLGGGGAERQLANTAIGLTSRMHAGSQIGGPVSIYCRKLDRRRSNDFYLARLEAAEVHVADYLAASEWGGDREASILAPHRELIDLLPPRMREGVIRLTDALRYETPDVVQIWQDGMIFAAGLSALLANVPRIILNVRTMPPNRRKDRQKPEQEVLYRGLLSAPGVTLSANSQMAGRAYEDWLNLPDGSVVTVPNGVDPLPGDAPSDEQARWERFDRETGHSGFVLGGVMRFDDNKRPLFWLEICAALAKRHRDARFIIAGSGPLRGAAEDHARRLGIAEQTLFVGRTTHIGFWLDRMDALALTSRHEGVPNALIEAQLAGVPVLTTPAGGAPEAVAPVEANAILSDAESPSAEEAAAHLATLAQLSEDKIVSARASVKSWARDHFAMDQMVKRTIDVFMNQ
ncbi:glycosyltransferase [Parasphingopyxis sp. CP4]|uniref:glycosyltransferase n=1 Tax=Parasphingopyxis sp. CP4 TaxID=2724527 RepID=UPI0015A37BCC|nr:glycosyltransferase [Parasphingopyxis sp. CP4]QLC21056.1 glycosyltransferase [Parasphingopyxis sp. CP4]